MNFIPRKILAIDISDSSIEILQMSQFLGKIKVSFLSRSELERGIVGNGEILKKKQLILKIKKYAGDIAKSGVAIALPDTIVSSCIFKFSGQGAISNEEIISEAKKAMQINFDERYYDFFIQDIAGEKIVFFASALKKNVDEYKLIFEELNFTPKIFDLNSLCALRSLNFEYDGTLVVDFGGKCGVLSIFDDGLLRLTSVVNFGGENFTEKLSEKLNVSYEQAEIFKMTYGFDPDKEEGRIFLVLQEVVQPLIDEIRKTINAYEIDNKNNKKKIRKIILSGGSGLMPKLDEYIFENFGINTQIGRPQLGNLVSEYLKSNNIENEIDTIFFAATIGLATRYLGVKSHFNAGINLLESPKVLL